MKFLMVNVIGINADKIDRPRQHACDRNWLVRLEQICIGIYRFRCINLRKYSKKWNEYLTIDVCKNETDSSTKIMCAYHRTDSRIGWK